jgi:hypothetical protein
MFRSGCGGGCCHLNHVEHENGSCCAHDLKRVRATLPLEVKKQAEERSRRTRITLGQYLRAALETYGTVTEVYHDQHDFDDAARVELALPRHLAKLIEKRDRAFLSRRVRAFFLLEGA